MRLSSVKFLMATIALCTITESASASTITFQFDATLQSGGLAGTEFTGTGSYDTQGSRGIGKEYLNLTSLNFTLLGTSFTRNEIDQGGQAILENGALSYFTAAYFLPPPDNSPVSDIAFGFGGPGIIGYIATGTTFIGLGTYNLVSTPEPSLFGVSALGILLIAATSRVWRRPSPSPSRNE